MFQNQKYGDWFGIRRLVFMIVCLAVLLAIIGLLVKATRGRSAKENTPTPLPAAAGPTPKQAEQVLQALVARGARVEMRIGFAGKYPLYVATVAGRIVGAAYAINTPGDNLGLPQILMGLDADGHLLGFALLGPAANKPGVVTDSAALEAWLPLLVAKGNEPRTLANTRWRLKEDRGEIEPPAAGNAIRPRAVLLAIRDGLDWFHLHRAELLQGTVPFDRRASNPAVETGGAPDRNMPASRPFPPKKPAPAALTGSPLNP
jgi:Na+-translocating ferredoxin:NAD+ oxidoreductase RnfG subunit